ncbi:MAG: cell division protein ZapA [Clostridiales bacterium]|jgi:cell division protein ZapA|nr:cell division protein ZapA [Clostridiales bacterium]
MGDVNKIHVEIFGELLTLVSDEDEKYIKDLAAYIDSKIDDIAHPNARAGMHPTTLSLLASVIIADELFKERGKNQSFNKDMEANIKENERLQTLVDELWQALEQTWNDVNAQKEELERAHAETVEYKLAMEKARNELADYIEAFDSPGIKGVITTDLSRKNIREAT